MARRANKGDGAGGLLLLGFLAIVFVVIPAALTLTAYVGILCILVGLIIFEARDCARPKITSATEFYSAEDCAALDALRVEQETLRGRKVRVYRDADHLGLARRSHDPTRFDERKTLAKRLNAKLVNLDKSFAEVAAQTYSLKQEVRARREAWLEDMERWRSCYSGRLAFRTALISYLAIAATLLISKPAWVQTFSAVVSQHIWFPVHALFAIYGAIVIASGSSAVIGALAWTLGAPQTNGFLAGYDEFNEKWGHIDSEDSAEEFENDGDNPDDEYEHLDGESERNEHTDDQRTWYEILGVASDASLDEIKAAWRAQIKLYHRDKVETLGPKFRELADRESKVLNAAYEEGKARH